MPQVSILSNGRNFTDILFKNVIRTVQKYLPSDGADEALFHIIHDDGDKKFLDVHKQYRKSFSPHNLNSVFALHFESQVVTINRLRD